MPIPYPPVASRVSHAKPEHTCVSAGIEFALVLAGILTGEPYAKALQLGIEYDPQPSFHAGSPAGAGPEITALMTAMYNRLVVASKAAARRLG